VTPSGLSLDDVYQARRVIAPYLRPTPLVRSEALSELLGCQAYLKCENVQPIGVFKIRGGINLLSSLSEEERLQYWMDQFGKCIKCYGCRNICPMCFCTTCTLDEDDLTQTGTIPPEKPIFHLIRAFHMAERCIDCGLCEEACPSGIPLRTLYKKMRSVVGTRFGFTPGITKEGKGPLQYLGDGKFGEQEGR